MNIDELRESIDNADICLIGIGEEFSAEENSLNDLQAAYNKIHSLIKDKNYFVVSICDDKIIFTSELEYDRITAPYTLPEDATEDKQWEKYMKWLSCTLNKKLLIIELGASLNKPQVIRWPFEKTVMINNKAQLIRINETMPNIPGEIKDKSVSIKANAVDFVLESDC